MERIRLEGVASGASAWYGIVFQAGAKPSSVTFADIKGANYGLLVRSTNPVTLANLNVTDSTVGLSWLTSAAGQLRRSVFERLSIGIDLAGLAGNTTDFEITTSTVRHASTYAIQVSS